MHLIMQKKIGKETLKTAFLAILWCLAYPTARKITRWTTQRIAPQGRVLERWGRDQGECNVYWQRAMRLSGEFSLFDIQGLNVLFWSRTGNAKELAVKIMQFVIMFRRCEPFLCWKERSVFQLILVNNTPVADVLQFVSKTFGMLLVTRTAEQQSSTLCHGWEALGKGACVCFFLFIKKITEHWGSSDYQC